MSDEQSRLVRMEERMQNIEHWVEVHEQIGEDVALLKQCVATYNGSIRRIESKVDTLNTRLSEWAGSVKMLRWVIGFVGLSGAASIVSVIVGLT